MRLRETSVDSGDSYRLLGCNETQKDYCQLMRLMKVIDSWSLMRLRETNGDS